MGEGLIHPAAVERLSGEKKHAKNRCDPGEAAAVPESVERDPHTAILRPLK
jgi:hypothetical protein